MVPAKIVSAGLVDNLKGMIPGFASGGVVAGGAQAAQIPVAALNNVNATNSQMITTMQAQMIAYIKQQQAAAQAAAAKAAKAVAGAAGSGGSNAANIALAKQMAAAAGWTGAEWNALDAVIMDESGGSSTVVNSSSGAAGIAQNISGFGPGYESGNAAQQIAWMISYIQGRYGDPEAALAHENAYHWYGSGGMINEPVIGFGVNSGQGYGFGERGPEMVTPVNGAGRAGGSLGDKLDRNNALMERLIAVTAAVPVGVGNHVGGAIGGAAQAASFRSRYPRGGS